MDWRNRFGLYGAYFCAMAGIGFTLPYLPVYLGERGLSNREIGILSTLAALSALVQFAVGIWSDRIGRHKPFLVVSLAVLAFSTFALPNAPNGIWLALVVILFAENGVCRAIVESQSGAEAVALADPSEVGRSLGGLRFWKPIGIILILLIGGQMAQRYGIGSILAPLAVIQSLAFVAALLIHEDRSHRSGAIESPARADNPTTPPASQWADPALWAFIAAMVLFHAANAPGGLYLGLFLERDLHAERSTLATAFVVSMIAWMLVVRPAGLLSDRFGRRPLLIAGWTIMAIRLGIVAIARNPFEIVMNQALDGLSNGLFAVLAAAWVTDRLGGARRAGEAQAIVGTSLVAGSAIGPYLSALCVDAIGYRSLFGALAGVGTLATLILLFAVPESLARGDEPASSPGGRPLAELTPSALAHGDGAGA